MRSTRAAGYLVATFALATMSAVASTGIESTVAAASSDAVSHPVALAAVMTQSTPGHTASPNGEWPY